MGVGKPGKCCVALLASSSVVFMLTWLSLIRAEYEVLLIAYVGTKENLEMGHGLTQNRPQSSPEAIRHLMKASEAFAICYDRDHAELVSETLKLAKATQSKVAPGCSAALDVPSLMRFEIPWRSFQSILEYETEFHCDDETYSRRQTMDSTAFLFHSSGTTGLPKLIPQTHNGAVGVLPRLQDDDSFSSRISTFTTTPLYHGGIADLLRSWSAASPLWLFPEGKLPIVGHTVADCIQRIDEINQCKQAFNNSRLGYLSCVPYVLESLCEIPEVKDRLCALDAVGVGGAAMPQELGDTLVADGMRLVSRFGSSECGFLLSSQRDYDTDKLWNTLRCCNPRGLHFVPMSDKRHELVVTTEWPVVSTANHAKRPFNTHDVFILHENLPMAWNYVGRSDSQLTLTTGKKFDPMHMEEALRRSDLIEDAVIIGDDRPFAAGVIFTSERSDDLEPDQQREEIWLYIQTLNESMPNHARLGRNSFCILNTKQHLRLRKNNKGGVIRNTFLSEFEKEVSNIYGSSDGNEDGIIQFDTLESIARFVQSTVQDVCPVRSFRLEDDLFDSGIDSLLSLQIRKRICDAVPVKLRPQIPVNIVYQCSTIQSISTYISKLLDNGMCQSSTETRTEVQRQEMEAMVNKYVDLQPQMLSKALEQIPQKKSGQSKYGISVLLTGSTGFLGVHILNRLLQDDRVLKIFLCTRGSDLVPYEKQQERAKARIFSTLEFHNMQHVFRDHQRERKIEFVPFLLKEPCLGIPPLLYNHLVSETTHVVHAAWEVNFNLPLKTFATQTEGTINLFNLILLAARRRGSHQGHGTASFIFCSSVASIARMPLTKLGSSYSIISKDAHHAADLGYGQSKWVAENVLERLSRQHPEVAVSVLRIGQLSGDTLHGIWNLREAWPLMIDASLRVFANNGDSVASKKSDPQVRSIILPDLAATALPPLDWLPVDYAAEKIWRGIEMDSQPQALRVIKVSNEGTETVATWREAQDWIVAWAKARDIRIKITTPTEWLHQLESLPAEHHAKALLSLWRQNWVGDEAKLSRDREPGQRENTQYPSNIEHLEGEKSVENYAIEKEYLHRILDWIARQ
jgi:nucleoside-diphosphate-sugar epimerase